MQTEGYAVRQMPQYKIDLQTLEIIRDAIQHSKMVTGIYHDKTRLIEPLGMVYGEKIYLVAREKDGSLTVTFKASGSKEIIWHVFKWGSGCKILSPKL